VSEERFDKIKFYLKYGKYPAGADRAEKSRLRSAATHYKLIPEDDKLMLKDKEVISDPQKQYEIARNVHVLQHGGINKTTATIAEKYHWVRIKETVSLVIRNCAQCKELGKSPIIRADGVIRPAPKQSHAPTSVPLNQPGVSAAGRSLTLPHVSHNEGFAGQGSVSPQVLNRNLPQSSMERDHIQRQIHHQTAPIAQMQNTYLPLDPQIMEDVHNHLGGYNQPSHSHSHTHDHEHDFDREDSFQDMIGAGHRREVDGSEDLDMLIDHDGEEDGEGEVDHDGNGDEDGAIIQLQAEAAARAAEEALRTVGREYGGD
jgi:hypothetical protein